MGGGGWVGGGGGQRGKEEIVPRRNTDESPVFKIPVRLRGFALRGKRWENSGARERDRGETGLVGIEVEGVRWKGGGGPRGNERRRG